MTVVAPPTTPTAERERWHGTRERVIGQHARRDDARAAAAAPTSEKTFSRSAPPQKRQRASALAAAESASLVVARGAVAVGCAQARSVHDERRALAAEARRLMVRFGEPLERDGIVLGAHER